MIITPTLLVATAVAASALIFPPATADPQCPRLQPIASRLVRDGAPGALVAVRTPSRICRAQAGVARRRPRTPLAATDGFRVGSITKTFVATLVLQLADQGKLRLDDPVDRWLPGLVPDGRAITLRMLLNHTSGLFDFTSDPAFFRAVVARPERRWSPRALVRIAARHRPLFPPGRGWSYSNTNYFVLGLIAEAAGGKPLAQQLRDRIFEPLDLTRTSFPSEPGLPGRHADGYVGFATVPRFHSLVDATNVVSPSSFWAAGGIVSTADDVTRFYADLFGGRVLPASLLTAMRPADPNPNYGLGLMRVDTQCGPAYGHRGDVVGYRSVVWSTADGSRVALAMINIDDTFVAQSELDSAAEQALCG